MNRFAPIWCGGRVDSPHIGVERRVGPHDDVAGRAAGWAVPIVSAIMLAASLLEPVLPERSLLAATTGADSGVDTVATRGL
ncbi:hypothetical protein Strop_1953 [Salinispora tropica CNB-440]|uniref:Uncharacterized protein n=1 Tax=Salinispora tropica (strain ATCC BAA-916 / DSM 44818 / JCM 13857 / NBRC 105044 / CNB-440) TaxID=369723 RepID=A4X6B3_SALTO|nr:hypothetical protein Strop_1953 [Salinispora tropica CNB-440]